MEQLNKKGKETLLEIAQKLGEYQKTNLTPEQIEQLKSKNIKLKEELDFALQALKEKQEMGKCHE